MHKYAIAFMHRGGHVSTLYVRADNPFAALRHAESALCAGEPEAEWEMETEDAASEGAPVSIYQANGDVVLVRLM